MSNFDIPMYEELGEPEERQPIKRSMSVTPGLLGMKSGEGVRPKDSSNRMSAFQDYTVVLLSCGCLSLNPFIEINIQNNSSSSDVLNIQASISISPKFESK